MRASTVRQAVTHVREHCVGRCPLCGHLTAFLQLHGQGIREGLSCVRCRSVCRKRHVALVVRELLHPTALTAGDAVRASGARVLSTERGDQLGDSLRDYGRYWTSELPPDGRPGEPTGLRSSCQDLQSLTYPDASFDLVLTEDVLEHVRRPLLALAEIHRVLEPGGWHVFTVPFRVDARTLVRVDTSGEEDVALLPAEYHGDALRGRILAYRTFGYDLLDELDQLGFATTIRLSGRAEAHHGVFDSLVLVSRKAPA